MIDFTSSLYLGMHHPANTLRPWPRLTTGRPAALDVPAVGRRVGSRLARLQGCQRAALARSSLHAFVDVLGVATQGRAVVLADASAYPVAGWVVEGAAGRGVPVGTFAHQDPSHLEQQLSTGQWAGRRPVVIVDGVCPGCGTPSPLARLLEVVRRRGGLLVLDDTQALGVLGRPTTASPYGSGGGGSLVRAGVGGPEVVAVSSLAKAFGAPLAVVAGSDRFVRSVEGDGPTRSHSSPPSAADLAAAERALGLPGADARRQQLLALVRRFRRRLREAGLPRPLGGVFPVQTMPAASDDHGRALHRRLLAQGVRAVLQRPRCRDGIAVTFLVTAVHTIGEIDAAVAALARAVAATGPSSGAPRATA